MLDVRECGAVRNVDFSEALGDEDLHALPGKLVARVAEHRFDMHIREDDSTLPVDHDEGVRGRFGKTARKLPVEFGSPPHASKCP